MQAKRDDSVLLTANQTCFVNGCHVFRLHLKCPSQQVPCSCN